MTDVSRYYNECAAIPATQPFALGKCQFWKAYFSEIFTLTTNIDLSFILNVSIFRCLLFENGDGNKDSPIPRLILGVKTCKTRY